MGEYYLCFLGDGAEDAKKFYTTEYNRIIYLLFQTEMQRR